MIKEILVRSAMIQVTEFEAQIPSLLPVTHALLRAGNLRVHDRVLRIVLHGSRGLAGCYRPDSDVDLSLIVDTANCTRAPELHALLQSILAITAESWEGNIKLDLAIVFDVRGCCLKCFDQLAFDPLSCPRGGVDCFGLYKKGHGFNGVVTNAGIKVKLMYPCITIWKRPTNEHMRVVSLAHA
jgi:hypothetical protein